MNTDFKRELKQYLKWVLVFGIPVFLAVVLYRQFMLSDQKVVGMEAKKVTLDPNMPELWWKDLYELDPKTSKVPQSLSKLHDKKVRIPGFAVPLEDNLKKVSQFLLVPDGMACIHVPPPPPNQIVLVTMARAVPIFELQGPLWVSGKFKINETKSQYGKASFELLADFAIPYQ